MARNLHNRPQTGPEIWMEPSDSRLPRPPSSGRPRRPIHYRPGTAWVVLAVSLTLLILGVALSQVVILAAGLVLAGTLGHLFDLRKAARHHPSHPSHRTTTQAGPLPHPKRRRP